MAFLLFELAAVSAAFVGAAITSDLRLEPVAFPFVLVAAAAEAVLIDLRPDLVSVVAFRSQLPSAGLLRLLPSKMKRKDKLR